jgi:hypothetical protein
LSLRFTCAGVQEGAVAAWIDFGVVVELGEPWAPPGSSSADDLTARGCRLGPTSSR